MAEQLEVSHYTSPNALQGALTVPQLFLSSEEAGWDDLAVYAYHEPMQIEEWVEPVVPDTVLVLLTHGAMLMERHTHGSWKAFPVRQHDLFLKPGGSVAGELRWKSLSQEPMQTLHVHLSSALIARVAQELADRDPARLALVGRAGFQDPLLAQMGLALRREVEQPTVAGKLYAQTAAQMLALHLLRSYTEAPLEIKVPSHGLTPRQLSRVTDFMLTHLDQDLSLPVLAQQAGFSPYHFARLFHQTTGQSPHRFVLRQRIERAKHLLTEADVPLAHVALTCGFANQGHLTRVFKRYVGLTPALYRKDS